MNAQCHLNQCQKHGKSNSDGKWTNELSDDISFDASGVSSSTDLKSIGDGLKLILSPKNAGKFIAIVKNKDKTLTPAPVDDPNSKKADSLRTSSDTLAYWVAPSITGGGTLTHNTDYTVAFPTDGNGDPVNNGKVNVKGEGNYANTATITLGQENIGNDDFHTRVAGLIDLGKVPMQRSTCEQVCIENRTMFFQIAAVHTPVLANLVFQFVRQREVGDKIIALLMVSAAHFLK